MEEQNKGVTQSASETASVEPGASSESKVAADQADTSSSQSAETTTPDSKANFNNSGDGKKPTRYERRIEKLIGKLKEKDNPSQQETTPDISNLLGVDPNQPLIRPEEAETGVDPNEFNRRLEAQRLADRNLIKKELQAEAQFKETVKDHLSDAEKTAELLKGDDVLDETVAEQYDLANYQINPFTGKREFVPRVKMSEIYAKQKKLLDAKIAKATADVSGKLADASQQGALSPSLQGDRTKSEEVSSSFEAAKESGNLETWAEHLKKLGIS